STERGSGPARYLPWLAAAPADGDFDFALHLQQGAVALLHDRAHVAGLAEPDVRAHERTAGLGRERHARDDGDPVLVGEDVDVPHVARGRHRRVDADGDGNHGTVLGDDRHVELDRGGAVFDGLATEEALHRVLDGLVLAERLGVRRLGRHGVESARDGDAEGTQRPQHRPPAHTTIAHHALILLFTLPAFRGAAY